VVPENREPVAVTIHGVVKMQRAPVTQLQISLGHHQASLMAAAGLGQPADQ
jgi:hypothetical protein